MNERQFKCHFCGFPIHIQSKNINLDMISIDIGEDYVRYFCSHSCHLEHSGAGNDEDDRPRRNEDE